MRARTTLGEAAAAAEAARAETQRLEAELRRSEAEAETADEHLARWRSERDALALAASAAHQELAVAQARVESLRLATTDLAAERIALSTDLATLEDRAAQLAQEVDQLAADHEHRQADLARAQAELAAAEEAHEASGAEAEALRVRLFTLAGDLTALHQQAAGIQAQIDVRGAERTRMTAERERLATGEGPLAQALSAAQEQHRAAEEHLLAVVAELASGRVRAFRTSPRPCAPRATATSSPAAAPRRCAPGPAPWRRWWGIWTR